MGNAEVDRKIAQDLFRLGEDLLARWPADVELEMPAYRSQPVGKPADIIERRSFRVPYCDARSAHASGAKAVQGVAGDVERHRHD